MATKYVYLFRDGNADMRDLLGGKGAGLAAMSQSGAPVPPGFTITTEACNLYSAAHSFPDGMMDEVHAALKDVEHQTGKTFGDPKNPLLVSVRSGAKFSMPGMMDTVLNLGLNPQTREGLAKLTDNPRFAADAYRRFVQLFGKIVLDVDGEKFEHVLDEVKGKTRQDTDLSADELTQIAERFKQIIKSEKGVEFPEDPMQQLEMAIQAVFNSWNGRRAVDYRRLNKISDSLGTAVNVQTMVFGNMGNDSATGVAFSRDPSTGTNELYGEFLVNAQGEDVVAGVRTPRPIAQMKTEMSEVYQQFFDIAKGLEAHYKDVQDMEFTVERGKLYMLQTRTGKRTGAAAVKVAVDLVNEGVISKETAIQRVEPAQLDQLLHPTITPAAKAKTSPLATGLPASPGAANGKVVFDPDHAEEQAEAGAKVILVRVETAPEDFHGMVAAQAVLTARGGMTSHAAVVARGMGKPCVAGCGALNIDYAQGQFTVEVNGKPTVVKEGDYITLDGSTGEVFAGQLETQNPELSGDFQTLMKWADEFRKIGVRTNADTPHDAEVARGFGAEGIGLCRTEHMFFEGNRIDAVREMIVASTVEERKAALAKVEPYQTEDFVGIFRAMHDLPVTIRTLDPPLHEFLPHEDEAINDLAHKMGIASAVLKGKVESLKEANPMLGWRGCRLGIVYPEITEMQARAIFTAAKQVQAEGINVHPEIMIPLVNTVTELQLQADIVKKVHDEVAPEVAYLIGTMIELPRAALVADKIAHVAQFFSFGTNDLTQTTMGISRDDSARFVPKYVEQKILADDPFQVLDQEGVGQLVQIGTERGRKTNPQLKVGICGEHGGEPSSVMFFAKIGLNYVSCSPFRVPIARLAAAQAALGDAKRDK
ncbi:MAG: pyruvate, phosphate dikinase [Herpetosiphonaceae bacterium]|nr:pyruvate, phosphate dikinase [Herpetosiphonaceae bacterium]